MNKQNVEVPARTKKYAGVKNTRRKRTTLGPTWKELNDELRATTTEEEALKILQREKARKPRVPRNVERAYDKYSVLRRARERQEVLV